jgi:hypothetical protein
MLSSNARRKLHYCIFKCGMQKGRGMQTLRYGACMTMIHKLVHSQPPEVHKRTCILLLYVLRIPLYILKDESGKLVWQIQLLNKLAVSLTINEMETKPTTNRWLTQRQIA